MKKIILISLFFLSCGLAHAQSSAQSWINLQTNGYNVNTPQQTGTSIQQRPGNLSYIPLEPLYSQQITDVQSNNLRNIFNNVFRLLLTAGALIAVVTLVFGGILYMTSEATGKKQEAKDRMTSSIYGLILLAASYLILNTINPNLLNINLQPGSVTGQSGQTQTTSGGTGGSGSTQVTVTRIQQGQSVDISDGSGAYDTLMNYNAQCYPGSMVPAGGGAGFTTWKCQ